MRNIWMALAIAAIIGAGIQYAYAQQGDVIGEIPEESVMGHVIAIVSFIFAGLAYALLGFAKKFRMALVGETVHIDYRKVRNSTILGVSIGIGAFILSIYNGDVIHIGSLNEFFLQVGLNSAAVLYIDKMFLGKPDNSGLPNHKPVEDGGDVDSRPKSQISYGGGA